VSTGRPGTTGEAYTPGAFPPFADHPQRACQGTNTDVFFPRSGDRGRAAKRICRACPLRARCREWAVGQAWTHGIWGGTSRTDREAIRKWRAREGGGRDE
jgi:WhiB family redox-sensing transcriptional regulator